MPSSRAIKPKRDDSLLTNWTSTPERAPSIERADRPLVARIMAMVGLFFVVLGTLAMLAPLWQRTAAIPPAWGFFFASLGLCGLLYHAYAEHDVQFRRLYGFLGLMLILMGIVFRIVAFAKAGYLPTFLMVGVPGLLVGLILLIGVIRNETDAYFRMILQNSIGGVAIILIAYTMARSMLQSLEFLPGEGAILLLVGLVYASAFIGMQESSTELGYYAAVALGVVGLVGVTAGLMRAVFSDSTYIQLFVGIALLALALTSYVVGLIRGRDTVATYVAGALAAVGVAFFLLYFVRPLRPDANFLVPSGLILMGMSLLYLIVALGVCIDWPVIVLTRRELAAYFYSPLAYLVLVGQVLFAFIMFWMFFNTIEEAQNPMRGGVGLFEPIIGNYIFNVLPVFVQMFFVPVLTMRLVSEEKRSGTLEVLLTAPVNEPAVVLGKFLACWIFYNLLWLPTWLFLISLRYYGGEEFDYRPILSFTVAMAAISAGFVSMGLFFSSLTRNQIIAAVFTFVGVMGHLVLYIIKFQPFAEPFADLLGFINYFDFMLDSLQGTFAPRFLVFHTAVAAFFLFATVKVLDSRRWI